MLAAIVCLALSQPPDASTMNAEQFKRIMAERFAGIQSVRLLYEGQTVVAGVLKDDQRIRDAIDSTYQGEYVYRNDGSQRSIVLTQETHTGSAPRLKETIFHDGNLSDWSASLDHPSESLAVRHSSGFPGVLYGRDNTAAFLYIWLLKHIELLEDSGFQCRGFEPVDGRACLRVDILRTLRRDPSDAGDDPRLSLWLDLERGGNPLRVEEYLGDRFLSRQSGITLKEFVADDGVRVWLPIAGRSEGFEFSRRAYREPVVVTTYEVIGDSVQLNRRIPDTRFDVARPGGPGQPEWLERARQRFREAESRAGSAGRDPQAEMDAQLAEAQAQASRLDASSRSRRRWSLEAMAPPIFAALGIGLLAGSLYLRWRQRLG